MLAVDPISAYIPYVPRRARPRFVPCRRASEGCCFAFRCHLGRRRSLYVECGPADGLGHMLFLELSLAPPAGYDHPTAEHDTPTCIGLLGASAMAIQILEAFQAEGVDDVYAAFEDYVHDHFDPP